MSRQKITPSLFIGNQQEGLISFGSGQPDLPPPKEVYQILPHYRDFKYGQVQGMQKLREALAWQYPKSTAESFVITNGASEALDLTLRVLARNGDQKPNKVLMARPYYYSYPHIATAAGMDPIYTDVVDGRIDINDFEKKIKDCKAVIINSPSNPTGCVESVETLQRIEELTSQYRVYVLSDEVYKDLIYTRQNYLIKGPHVVTINSFSKTYAMCGFRVGYLWSLDQDLVNKVVDMKSHTSMNTNILGQEMAFEATKVPSDYIFKQMEVWKSRRDLIYEGMKTLGLELWKPEGAFYVLPKVDNSEQFTADLYYDYKVITYMGDWFGAPGRTRFSYALDAKRIEEGLNRVGDYLKSKKKTPAAKKTEPEKLEPEKLEPASVN
jgi:aspartate aminotransferase